MNRRDPEAQRKAGEELSSLNPNASQLARGLKVVFSTPWFQVLERPGTADKPYYVIESPDFVVILALNERGQIIVVRQFRPGVNAITLELPAGHIEPGETPEQAARKELLEETGFEGQDFELLGTLSTSTARCTNRTWCFFVHDARPSPSAEQYREPGLEPVIFPGTIKELVTHPEFYSATACGVLLLAQAKGRIDISR